MAKNAARGSAALVIALGLIGMPAAAAAPALTMVQRAEKSAPAQHATRLVEAMTTQERAASIVMGHIPATDPAVLAQYMADTGIGGFILMGANIPDDEGQLQRITAALSADPAVPALVAIDQEGGLVSRLPWDDFAASTMLKNAPVEQTQVAFAGRAALVARAGATVNFGVVADTTADTGSFIYGRALGADPVSAAARVAAAVAAEEPLAASTLKHFPGHGATPGDSHELIPSTSKSRAQWEETDAVPFVAGIEAGASLLMFGHLAYTAVDELPASMSATWHAIARDDLGFDGVIVTDDLGMLQSSGIAAYADPVANAVAAVAAGNDLVLTIAHSTPQTVVDITQGIVTAVENGVIDEERLQDAAERVMTLRLERAASAAVWSPAD